MACRLAINIRKMIWKTFEPRKITRNKIIVNYTNSKNHLAFMKTHVISNYIENLNNDINMVDITTDNDDSDYQCKYIHYFRAILIIILMIFMFIGKKDDDPLDK